MPSKTTDFARIGLFIRTLCDLADDETMPSQQQLLLLALATHGRLNQAELNDHTGVKKASNSRNIAKLGIGERPLEQPGPGLVVSEEDLRDRRTNVVRLTAKGQAIMDEAWARAFGPKSPWPNR